MRIRCSYSMTTRRGTKHTEIGLQISLEQVALRAAGTPLFVDEAIATIKSIAVRKPYKRIIYSAANPNGDLGTSIFHVGNDVKEYIVSRLKSLDTLDQRHPLAWPHSGQRHQ
jgi:hypothetical protein